MMNLDYSQKDKMLGFVIFIGFATLGFFLIFFQTQSLKYPLATSVVAGLVPTIIRVIFDFGNIHKVLVGKELDILK